MNQPNFSKIDEICVKIMKRINDEEGIKVCIEALLLHAYVYSIYLFLTATGHYSFPAVMVYASGGCQ